MYDAPPGKSSRATRPPCFWNCGTAAGEVLKTRHGALPAVMAAPMTSSELLPAGISCAVTFSLGFFAFQSATMALPQASSSVLFESQILSGPFTARSPDEEDEPPLPPHAVTPSASATRAAAVAVRFIRTAPFGGGDAGGLTAALAVVRWSRGGRARVAAGVWWSCRFPPRPRS